MGVLKRLLGRSEQVNRNLNQNQFGGLRQPGGPKVRLVDDYDWNTGRARPPQPQPQPQPQRPSSSRTDLRRDLDRAKVIARGGYEAYFYEKARGWQ